jgi:hypothetical protein
MRRTQVERVVLKGIGSKRDKVTGGWRVLHNELRNMCFSPDIIRMITSGRMRWLGHAACIGRMKNAYRIMVGKPEGKIPHRRLGCRCRIVWCGLD